MPKTQPKISLREVSKDLQKRSLTIQEGFTRIANINEEERTVELAFSSEIPYSRWWGDEILDHSEGAIDFTRLQAGAAFLLNHDWDRQIGVVQSARIDGDRVARAVIKFSRSDEAMDVFRDIQDGIRQSTSVGYFIKDMVLERHEEDTETYRVTKWQPYEISLVSVPADHTVGVGRSLETQEKPTEIHEDSLEDIKQVDDMSEPEDELSEVAKETRNQSHNNPAENTTGLSMSENIDTLQAERNRVNELLEIGEKHNAQELAQRCIKDGSDENTLNKLILERSGHNVTTAEGTSDLGLSNKEVKDYSVVRLLNALANPNDKAAQRAAAFELEVSAEAAKTYKRESRGAIVPQEILTRDHTVGTATAGGNLVANDLMSGSFIDILQNRMALVDAGATIMSGLEGNLAIPRQTGGVSTFWLNENGEPTESAATFDQIAMTPKTIGAYTELSRKFLQQSSIDGERFTLNELSRVMALGLDHAGISGTGLSNQPTGILAVNGIKSVVNGDDGGIPTFGKYVDMETELTEANADVGNMRYLMPAAVRGSAKQTEITANSGRFIMSGNEVNGYPVTVSNQLPTNGTKGSGTDLSTVIFGNFSDLIIGMWGGLDLQVNPYSLDTKGAIRVTAFQDCDLVVRHPESFCAMTDVKTS